MGTDLGATRRHLLSLAVQEDKRFIDDPNDWRPYEVNNPREPGEQFNHDTAWALIVELLSCEHPIRERPQNQPPGAVAYEMIICLEGGWDVYIKIRAGKRGRIFGRSFHYAEG